MDLARFQIIGTLPIIVGVTAADDADLRGYRQQQCLAAVDVELLGEWTRGVYNGEDDILYVHSSLGPVVVIEGVLGPRRRRHA